MIHALVLPDGVRTVRDLLNVYLSQDRYGPLEVIKLTEEHDADRDGSYRRRWVSEWADANV